MMTKKYILLLLLITAFIAISCARTERWSAAHAPADDACKHCHFAIYKDFKISYSPYNERAKTADYEPVHARPMSGADVRMAKGHKEGKGECSECHVFRDPQGQLIISKIGLSFGDTTFQICGRCHKGTFEEWKESSFPKREISCMSCHTNAKDKPIADEKGYYHTKKGLKGLSKELVTPAIRLGRLKDALLISEEIKVWENEINVLIRLLNKGVGHNLPTDAIDSALLTKVELVDMDGNIIRENESLISAKEGNSIVAGRESILHFPFSTLLKGKYKIRIYISHLDREKDKDKSILMFHKSFDVSIK